MAHLLSPGLLGRHVLRSAHDRPCRGQPRFLGCPGYAKVGQRHPLPIADHDIRRFDVAVDKLALVSIIQGIGEGTQYAQGLVRRQCASLADMVGQCLPFEVLHDKVELLFFLPHIVHCDDIGMFDPRGGPGLAQEALHKALLPDQVRR